MSIRNKSLIAFVAALIVFVAAPSFAWKFVSMADSRGSNNGVNTTVLNNIVNRINAENADLVIFQGDAVNGSSNSTTLASQMDTWLSVMNKLNCKWYFTVGNHEISSSGSHSVIRSKVNMPTNGPSGYEETVYSFDHQNAHFVALNSNHYGQTHRVQRSWLKTDLANTKQPHVFVMAHEPAYPYGPHKGSSLDVYASERDDFWNIMTAGRVNMYFCGHEHLYGRKKIGSIYQVLNGSCGAPLNTGNSGTTARYHYVVVEINGYDVTCTTKTDTGSVIDSWSYSVSAPTTGSPSITLALTADSSTALPGSVVTYTVSYKNTGDSTATGVVIECPVPGDVSYVAGSATSSGAYNSSTRKLTWSISSLATGGSGVLQYKVKVS